jgi:hypothetical protein
MSKTQNNQAAMTAFKRAQADIASLADWFECEMQKYDEAEVTWATVGSLEHVRENLIETLAFLSGINTTEIQRSLDELRM